MTREHRTLVASQMMRQSQTLASKGQGLIRKVKGRSPGPSSKTSRLLAKPKNYARRNAHIVLIGGKSYDVKTRQNIFGLDQADSDVIGRLHINSTT